MRNPFRKKGWEETPMGQRLYVEIEKEPIPNFCPIHGCELREGSYQWKAYFDPHTGVGHALKVDLKECPNRKDHGGFFGPQWTKYQYEIQSESFGTWTLGEPYKVPVIRDIKDCDGAL